MRFCGREGKRLPNGQGRFSWERFFTALLVGKTRGTYLQYEKKTLNPAYLQDREMGAIKGEMPKDIGVPL